MTILTTSEASQVREALKCAIDSVEAVWEEGAAALALLVEREAPEEAYKLARAIANGLWHKVDFGVKEAAALIAARDAKRDAERDAELVEKIVRAIRKWIGWREADGVEKAIRKAAKGE